MTERLPPGLRWIAFDLDDTLHYFERASGRASEAVFCEIERQFGIGVDDLGESYRKILRAAQGEHFLQPKTSREYRAERFGALLRGFDRDPGPQLDRLLDIYDAAFGEALEPKPGAVQALLAAKRAGLSVMVVSEGPHDAQATTIERLGIAASIDLLVTSAGEGASKSDGLFAKALQRAGCEPHEVLHVGDSVDRDIAPTSALGIASVYVGEDELPDGLAAMRLDLAELGRLLGIDFAKTLRGEPVLIVTGPPGVGKTTTARILAERSARSVHLEADAFFRFIRSGHIEPWSPESREQNRVVMEIVAEAAAAYASAGYLTLIDGIVLPEWFLTPLSEALHGAGHRVAYAVLREPVSVCVARVQAREGDPALVDADVIERIWRGFADLGDRERHALDLEGRSPERAADLLARRLADGRLAVAAGQPSR